MKYIILFIIFILIACANKNPKDPINPLDPLNNEVISGYNSEKVLSIIQVRELLKRERYSPYFTSNNIYWEEDNIYGIKEFKLNFDREGFTANSEHKSISIKKKIVWFEYYDDIKTYFSTLPNTYTWPIYGLKINYLYDKEFDIIIQLTNNFYNDKIKDIIFYEDSLSVNGISLNSFISGINNGSYKESNNYYIRFNSNIPLDNSKYLQILWNENKYTKYYKIFEIDSWLLLNNLGRLNFKNVINSSINFNKHSKDNIYFIISENSTNIYKVDKYSINDQFEYTDIPSISPSFELTYHDSTKYAYIKSGSQYMVIFDYNNMTFEEVSTSELSNYPGVTYCTGPFEPYDSFIGCVSKYSFDLPLYFFNSDFTFITYLHDPILNDIGQWCKFVIDKNAQLFVEDNRHDKLYHFNLQNNQINFIKEMDNIEIWRIWNHDDFILVNTSDSKIMKISKSDFSIDWIYDYVDPAYPSHVSSTPRYISSQKDIVVFYESASSDYDYLSLLNWESGDFIKRFRLKIENNFSIGDTNDPNKLCIIYDTGLYGEFSINP